MSLSYLGIRLDNTIHTFDYINSNPGKFFRSLQISSQNYIFHYHEEYGQCLVLMVRPENDRSFPNELCATGGKNDPVKGHPGFIEDATQTAIRETLEELGLKMNNLVKFGQVVTPHAAFVNFSYSEISSEDLKKLSPNRDEVAAAVLAPIDRLRQYKSEERVFTIKYKSPYCLPENESKDLVFKAQIMNIKKEDLHVLWGEIKSDSLMFRPMGYREFERVVLSRKNQPDFKICQSYLTPCYNIQSRDIPIA